MKLPVIKEENLGQLIKEGNGLAFDMAFRQYRELLFRHAYGILRDMDETEDVVQEVYTDLWEKRDLIPDGIEISGYLYRMTRNRVLNKLKHDKVIVKYLEHAIYQQKIETQLSDQWVLEKELATIIEAEIKKLPQRMQEIFLLSRKEGLSHKEIASLLQITEGTSKLQVSKALKILKNNVLIAIALLVLG
ncbi:RNA polymerase sigma-70 factor, ECF subfamily [Sphingobacterium nematocida]|uniref:RNA polymerase sigma-70 factor, ECF subfamily n=1 Tax=Sphingobacterium nematocida TaxID=1513896 RepID=A0A1T5FZL4_9SPHI|nr:RNA polymerase sigma-70 factor [Sphingobacterium nematocida]SKC01636.1 RNA polymerase sigma-70 factor, ECF subfamily [Sphingobacterium nematocida]